MTPPARLLLETRVIRKLAHVYRTITRHPLNQGRKARALLYFFVWQCVGLAFKARFIVDWIDQTRLIVRKGDTGITGNLYTGLFEKADMHFVLCRHKKDDLFIDVGANGGVYTLLAASVVGSRAIGVEPIPAAFEMYRDNLAINRLNGSVTALNLGCSDAPGDLVFTTLGETAINHVATEAERASLAADKLVSVPVRTLDSIYEEWRAGHDAPGDIFLKIDVEGFEWECLHGARSQDHPGRGQ